MLLMSEVLHRNEVVSLIIKELSQVGIKAAAEKYKVFNGKRKSKKIFNVPIELLVEDKALMANGKIGEVPKVVSTCCRRLSQDLEVEGLFRKNGSFKKQKSLVEHLEKFGNLDRTHHAIDVANVLKSFFRNLPVPLIPVALQEQMIRCLSLFDDEEMKCEVILLLLLLLPPITVNTLAYFLQFIKTVTRYSNKNLMTSENLVKVLTPTLMPPPANATPDRLSSHFVIVELLIANANSIGVLPDRLAPSQMTPVQQIPKSAKNYNKRRSINRVFNGLKKMVNNLANSTEELDAPSDDESEKIAIQPVSSKKRRETTSTFESLPTKVETNVQKLPSDFVKIPKSEYEAFKERLNSIESKISKEFHLTKLENIKSENSQFVTQQYEEKLDKLKETLNEVQPIELNDRGNSDFLAKRMSRGLNIRKSIELHRSPSARKIGSLKRRRNVSLSRNLSWHLGQEEKDKLITEIKSPKRVQVDLSPKIPAAINPEHKKVPEKPVRLKLSMIDQSTPAKKPVPPSSVDSWTPAADFFKENPAPSNNDMLFKTPNSKKIMGNRNLQFSTPKFSPNFAATPLRNFHAQNRSAMMNQSGFHTPGHQDTSQGRESIIVLRNRLNGMVKSKIAALENVDTPVRPLTIVNKNLRNVQVMGSPTKSDRKQRENPGVRRSPRSICKKSPLKMSDTKFNVLSQNYL